jgi:hypothetical protein
VIHLASEALLRPLVAGPERVPLITDPRVAARDPELAVLSAMARGPTATGQIAVDLATAALRAVDALDVQRAMLYSDLILTACGEAARVALEALMTQGNYEYQSEWMRKQFAEGEAMGETKGAVRALLTVLDGRRLPLSAEQRGRIEACRELATLEGWLRRALTVSSAAELFTA